MAAILYIGNHLNSNNNNLTYSHTLGQLFEQEGYVLFYASSKKNKVLRLLDMLGACVKYRTKTSYVLIDTYSTLNFYYALMVSQLCRVLRLKYMTILHGGQLPKRLKENPVMSKLIFNKATHNIAPSQYLMETFKGFGFHNMVHIPNAISIRDYPFNLRKDPTIKLLWVRSFSKMYNPHLAVKVLKAMKDKGMKASLCMVGPDGDGSLKEVKTLADNLDVAVTFTGKLTKQEWMSLSNAYTIFINTSNLDNMPLSVIEAMALGLPVISTDVGGMPYLIAHGKDGLLVEPNDVAAFVNAITWLTDNKDAYRDIAKNARKKVEAYDWEQVKAQWLQLLK